MHPCKKVFYRVQAKPLLLFAIFSHVSINVFMPFSYKTFKRKFLKSDVWPCRYMFR